MDRRLLLALFSVLLVSVTVYAVLNDSDESDAATADNVRVFVERADGTYAETVVSGTSVKQIIENACADLNMALFINSQGVIKSVDGVTAPSKQYWNIHQWMPLGTHDWASVGFDSKSDSQIISGTTYCLHISGTSLVSGTIVYGTPDFSPKSDGYVFIRFDYGYDSEDPRVQEAFTVEDRADGFWIKGHGSNMGEVVKDAMESNGFEAGFLINTDSNGNDLQYWITSFFGIAGDMSLGSSKDWAYWSQYVYLNDKWSYNDWTLGYYDPGVYKYVGIVYIISIDYSNGTGEEQNVLQTLPDVTDEAQVRESVKERYHTVTFKIDGNVKDSVTVEYGHQVSSTPSVEVSEGHMFSGWGDTTQPIFSDKVFEGTIVQKPVGLHVVTYLDEHGGIILNETVADGSSAVSMPSVVRIPTNSQVFDFVGWSVNGTDVADMSSVTSDLSLVPLFDAKPRMFTVTFYGYDGSVIGHREVAYGQPLTDYPDEPARSETVDKVYAFAGWSIALYTDLQMDHALLANLSHITTSRYVFAAYTYVPHPYTLTVLVDDGTVFTRDIAYGRFLTEEIMMDSLDDHLLKFYRDEAMTKGVGTSFIFTGDSTLYAKRIPGSYTYSDSAKGSIRVAFDPTTASELIAANNLCRVADISDFSGDKSVVMDSQTLGMLTDVLGRDILIEIVLPRATISIGLGGLCDAVENGEDVSFTVNKGPTSSVRINSSLKNVNWDSSYTISMKIGGRSVNEPSSENMCVWVSVPYTYDPAVQPVVWSANANTGVLTPVPCTYSDGRLLFEAPTLLYYFAGTSGPRSSQVDDRDYCPYGDVKYTTYSMEGTPSHSTLDRMDIDCHGEILLIPSSLEGYELWTIGPDAFSGVLNAPVIVVPASVRNFDWTSLYNIQVKEVYFLGDLPEFDGEAPAHVSVYYSDKASGWSSTPYGILSTLVYSKGTYSFQYCVIDEQIVVMKYLSGTEVVIPQSISVNGTDRPVTTIGCNAFEDSPIISIYLPDTVTVVQTRAFYHCSSLEQLYWGSSPSVKVLADECFRGCLKLRSSTTMVPDGTRFIGFEAFRDCQMIRSLHIPNSVTDIRGGAFYDCLVLADVDLSDKLVVIPERCFGYCNFLDGVFLPDSVTTIGENAFYHCIVLTDINLNNVEIVGYNAFHDCQSLVSVTLGKSLKVLEKDCFSKDPLLTEVIAYCTQPEGYEACGLSSEAVLYANYDVAGGWNADHQVIEKEDDLKRSFEAETMPYVVGAMIVIMIGLAIATVIYRRRCLL